MRFVPSFVILSVIISSLAVASDGQGSGSPNTRQYYSGKFGYFQPSDGLNNGLLLGVDGITEFVHYNFMLSGAIELYPKQSISIFRDPQPGGGGGPDIQNQQILLLPLHVNVGYKLFEVADADTRGFVGIGGGYYFYFYNVDYHSSSGGLLGGTLTSSHETKNGGNAFGSIFARLMINQVFVEPRVYLAAKSEDQIGGYSYVVNPSGYSLTLGFQYH